jgi:calcium-dependent protein kinase
MLLVESSNLLQPENILLASKESETLIKVADFGVSKILRPGTQMDTRVGTQCYQAPEILDAPKYTYTRQVDIWSMGILLYFW